MAKVLANGGLVWLAGYLIGHYKAENPERAPFYAWMIIMGLIGALLIALSGHPTTWQASTPPIAAGGQYQDL